MKLWKSRKVRIALSVLLMLFMCVGGYGYVIYRQSEARREFEERYDVDIYFRSTYEEDGQRDASEDAFPNFVNEILADHFEIYSVLKRPPRDISISSRSAWLAFLKIYDLNEVKRVNFTLNESDPITDADIELLLDLPNLREVWLNEIPVTGKSLNAIRQLPRLTRLAIFGTKITGKEIALLAEVDTLRELTLSHPQNDEHLWNSLLQLPQLEDVSCAGLEVTDEMLSQVDTTMNWDAISWWSIPLKLTDKGMASLKYFPKLGWLNLSGSEISDESLSVLSDRTYLTRLILNDTPVTDEGLKSLERLPELRFLYLRKTKVTGTVAHTLRTIPNLYDVDLGETSFDDEGLKTLSHHEQVSVLTLDHTPITDASILHLNKIKPDNLHIGHTNITGAGLKELNCAPTLSTLSLQGLSFSKEEIRHLFNQTGYKKLDLAYSSWDDDYMDLFQGLLECSELDLSGKNVTDEGLSRLAKHFYPNNNRLFLNILYLNDRPLTSADINVLKNIALSLLQLNRCGIDDEQAAWLAELKIEWLYLNGNPITDQGLEVLLHDDLFALHLSGTLVTDEGMKLLESSEIRTLDISNTAVSDAAIPYLDHLPELNRALGLKNNQMTPEGRQYLRACYPFVSNIYYESN
ncbi:MAG: hypothetical protein KDA65_09895 [Planctomycetaceae bacterium]|nr:hypothetical protein [Planctomycetaceae bacterium]